MKFVKAKIEWLVSKERIPPVLEAKDRQICNAYTPLIVFDNQYNRPIFEGKISHVPLWSSVIFNEEIIKDITISFVSYLVDEAPYEFLKIGNKFKLYEGASIVAVGEIVE